MIVYISGKYTGKTEQEVNKNIMAARKVAVELWNKGYTALCPHLNTIHFETDCKATYDDYINGDLEMLLRCDAIVMLPGWEQSKGAKKEYDLAIRHKVPIYEYPMLPIVSNVEVRCPNQTQSFLSILMSMYRMYLIKNNDYGPANILGTGSIGLVTRMWDKMARIMHLSGFKINISDCVFDKPIEPKNEAIIDSWHDIAVYSVIGMVHREGNWGK